MEQSDSGEDSGHTASALASNNFDDDLAQAMQPDAPRADSSEVERAKFAYSLKTALAFFNSTCYGRIYMLLVTLHPEKQLMATTLHGVSENTVA